MSKVLQEIGFGSLPRSTKTNPKDHVKSISTTIEADMTPIRSIESSRYVISYHPNTPCRPKRTDHIDCNAWMPTLMELYVSTTPYLKMRKTREVSLYLVCFYNTLADLGASVSEISKRNSLECTRRDCALDPWKTILSTAHAKIDVFKRKITLRVGDEKIIFKSMKPASSLIKKVYMLGLRECMELDLEARLMGETLVLNRSLDPLYGDYIELNDLNVPLELRRDQVDDLIPTIEEGEVIDEPVIEIIKTRNSIIVENMDGYRDQDMGDVIVGEPFCKASCVQERRTLDTAIPEIGFCMFFLYFAHDLVGKEIDKVGEVSIIWNPMCVVLMLRCSFLLAVQEVPADYVSADREVRFCWQFKKFLLIMFLLVIFSFLLTDIESADLNYRRD
ncbi:hypothetical protein Tco_1281830 [Tanacetum coccineum]